MCVSWQALQDMLKARPWLPDLSEINSWISVSPWPSVHKAFQNQDQDQTQAQVKHAFTVDFLWNLL